EEGLLDPAALVVDRGIAAEGPAEARPAGLDEQDQDQDDRDDDLGDVQIGCHATRALLQGWGDYTTTRRGLNLDDANPVGRHERAQVVGVARAGDAAVP